MNRKDFLILGALLLMATDRKMFTDDEVIEIFNGTDNAIKFNEFVLNNGIIPTEETKALLKEYVDKYLNTL